MKKIKLTLLFCLVFASTLIKAQINYPETKIKPVENTYHGIKIIDNYQWLENIRSDEVKNWVKQQNKISKKYLNKLVLSSESKRWMDKLSYHKMDYDNFKDINDNDKLYFSIMYPNIDSTPSIYYAKGINSSFERLIDPNSISTKDQIVFTDLTPSKNGRFLAYQYSRNGSDWKEIKIVQIKKRHYFKEVLRHTISSEIYWLGQGFFYKKYPYDSTHGKRIFPKVMYHKLGTEQLDDKLIFGVEDQQESLRIYGTPAQNFYIIKKANQKYKKFSYYYLNPKNNNLKFNTMFENISYDISVIGFKLDTVLALTTIKGKKFIFSYPISNPKKWKILSPSYAGAVFTDYEVMDDKIVISYQSKKSSIISVVNYNSKVLGELITPEGLSVSNLTYSKPINEFLFKLSSYTVPPVTCKLDLDNYTFKYLGKIKVGFDAKNYKFMRKYFTSYDGTKIPMFIVYKDSLKKNGDTPFLLNTYGGYGTVAKPHYKPGVIYFIENGGAFAYVNVRGGGEFGVKWWNAGKNLNKKNAILDFTKAAEYLIEEGYTKPKKIAVTGASHGGLIAAAAVIEKPELYGAAVIDVGALDMLRFENSPTGATYTNTSEFGSVKNKEEFMNLLSYSPYHNIDYSINYPSMLILTGSDDTRVPPYHSCKFVGKLQNNPSQKNPILLWSQDKTGHFGANEFNAIIKERAYIYSFLFQELKK
jgi:prolyl oligopeptidase